jgi:hypothetical protein
MLRIFDNIEIELLPALRDLLDAHLKTAGVSLYLLAQRLREGLDATKKIFCASGKVCTVPDFRQRRLAVELCLVLKGILEPGGRRRKRSKNTGKSIGILHGYGAMTSHAITRQAPPCFVHNKASTPPRLVPRRNRNTAP